jgi:ubiquinone/menaquinone biosynthesis C-methylase UbiE
MLKTPNQQFSTIAPESLSARLATWQRRRMFQRFLELSGINPGESLLDVGVTSDTTYESSNYVEAWYPYKDRITAAGIDDAGFLETLYPGVKFVNANGLDLPFDDRSFDVAHSSAVLEHVGSRMNQVGFVRELARVARRAVFLTTPNRWFPVEFHTVLPVVHWLPKPIFRGLMRRSGNGFFAEEGNLNLIGAGELRAIAREALPEGNWRVAVGWVSIAGWPSNLLLSATR